MTDDEPITERVEFLDYHRPALASGRYTITVTQRVTAPGTTDTNAKFQTPRTFTVAGDAFTLPPSQVYAVFPPRDSLGDHAQVLPHVVVGRSTLPWELRADGAAAPWLALLLFTEDEALGGAIERQPFVDEHGADLWNHLLDANIGWLTAYPGSSSRALIAAPADRRAAVLAEPFAAATGTVDALLSRGRTPQVMTLADLTAATTTPVYWPGLRLDPEQHAPTDKVTVIDVPRALLTAQLTDPAGLSLLTHVRRAETADGTPAGDERAVVVGRRLPKPNGISEVHLVAVDSRWTAAGANLGDAPYVRLISLTSWRFTCADPNGDLTGLLAGLGREPSTLRLPPVPDAEAETHLAAGRVPVPHRLRSSATTVSWYRSPLLPGPPAPGEPALPAAQAADLIRYDPTVGMFDASWAAAWEAGRLLALRSKPLSRALVAWKHTYGQAERSADQWLLHPTWTAVDDPSATPLPADVTAWFDDLRVLRGVPLHYLVPDEHMLPPESIRFVQLDPGWVECLVDGAFSIGRRTHRPRVADARQRDALLSETEPHPAVTGFLVRSSAVAGWPGLLADAYADDSDDKLATARIDRLAPDLMLCLFTGQVARVQFHLAPETLHFGTKRLSAGWLDTNRVADLTALAAAAGATGPPSAAEFAVRLVDPIPRVTFKLR